MASGRIKGITIEIGGDTTKLQQSLSGVDKSLKQTERNLKDVDKLLKLDPKNTELLTQKQKLLKDAIGQTKDRLQQLKDAQSGVEKGTAEWDALQREIIDTEQDLKGLEDDYRSFGSVASQQIKAVGEQVKQAGEKISDMGEKLAPVSLAAGALGGALLKMGYDTVQSADELNTLSKQTGVSTDTLQKWSYAADLVDVSVEDITGALKKMKPKMTDSNETFEKLGVSVKKSDGSLRDAEAVFYDTINALSKVENETERDQLAMELFGKSADQLAGVVDDGGAALKAYGEEAESMGLILDGDTLDALNETNDTIDKVKNTTTASLAKIGANVSTVLAPIIEKLAGYIETISEKLRELSPEQTELILKIVAVVAAVAPVLIIVGKIVSGIGTLISIIGTIVGVLGGPLTIAIAAIIAIGILLWKNWDTVCQWAQTLKERVVEAWTKTKEEVSTRITELKTWITTTWDNIKTKVTTVVTNIKTKVTTIWNNIKTTVSNVVNGIRTAVTNAWNTIKTTVTNVMTGIKTTISNVWTTIKTTVSNTVTGIKTTVSTTFDTIKSKVSNTVDSIKSAVSSKFDSIKTSISNKINSAKTAVSNAIDSIKRKFNFSWSLPKLKLPHLSITGSFSINPPSVPHFSISWYKKAMKNAYLLDGATIFGSMGGSLLGGGEAGKEVIIGLDKLKEYASPRVVNASITINAAPGQDVRAIAREVSRELQSEVMRKKAVWA